MVRGGVPHFRRAAGGNRGDATKPFSARCIRRTAPLVAEAFQKALRERTEYQIDHRIIRPDGVAADRARAGDDPVRRSGQPGESPGHGAGHHRAKADRAGGAALEGAVRHADEGERTDHLRSWIASRGGSPLAAIQSGSSGYVAGDPGRRHRGVARAGSSRGPGRLRARDGPPGPGEIQWRSRVQDQAQRWQLHHGKGYRVPDAGRKGSDRARHRVDYRHLVAAGARGATAALAEDGGVREARRRSGARFQQPADRHHRLQRGGDERAGAERPEARIHRADRARGATAPAR